MLYTHWWYYPQILGYARLDQGKLIYRPKFFIYSDGLAAHVLNWDSIDDADDLTFWRRIEADLKERG